MQLINMDFSKITIFLSCKVTTSEYRTKFSGLGMPLVRRSLEKKSIPMDS